MKLPLIVVGAVTLFIPAASLLALEIPVKVPKTPDVSDVADKQLDKAKKDVKKEADKQVDEAQKKAEDKVEDATGETGKKVKEGKKTVDAINALTK
ncbi:hypothetical protein [Rubritalea sp.]|uniref:hypothetical protein n=1 Tax=Rubritalea sp. TaxID=2109375 RepID=UPI003EF742B9